MSEHADSQISRDTAAALQPGDLRRFPGAPREFWEAYLRMLCSVTGAAAAVICRREDGDETAACRTVLKVTLKAPSSATGRGFTEALEDLTRAALDTGHCVRPLATPDAAPRHFAGAVRLLEDHPGEACVAAVLFADTSAEQVQSRLDQLRLAADLPAAYLEHRALGQARLDVERFAAVMDLMVIVNAQKRFLAAAMTLCNEIASRYRCDRVSFGWEKGNYTRMVAMSHAERFDKKTSAVRRLEEVMEEASDQEEEIVCPPPEDTVAVTRDHAAYARDSGSPFLCTIPLLLDDKAVAALCCERTAEAFSEADVAHLRLCCDQATRRLADLRTSDRWFGARWAATARRGLAKLFGIEHTWIKLCAVFAAAVLAFLLFGSWEYRVQASFVLHTERVAYLPTPFDGYLGVVDVDVGDEVTKDQRLLKLDTQELLLEEAAAAADRQRYLREVEKARAENALADMQIASALAEQARVRLERVRYRLEQAEITAPFDGIVVEGDLKERVGAPVGQGEVLFKIARLEDLYVEAEVAERDIHEVPDDGTGEIAFVSRPNITFPVQIVRVEPAAQAKAGKNIFVVRCELSDEPQAWFRPGMSGICKVNVGRRRLLWIFTHRTVDFLRLALWW